MSLEDDIARFDPDAYALARQRATDAPLELTERDFDQLALVSPGLETEARDALHKAQLAIVQANADSSGQRSLVTKSAPAETWEQFVEQHGAGRMTVQMAGRLFDVLMTKWQEMNQKNVERNARLDALERRVLELEATQAAARPVDHVER